MQHWHVLYTKPNSEFKVLSELEARGIEGYLPALPCARRRAGRAPLRPYFPCYLFAQLDFKELGESRILYLPGLRNVVRIAGQPAVVSPEILGYVAKRVAEARRLDAGGQVLSAGDSVRILDPTFKDIDAVFDAHLTAEGRVRVFLRCLERSQSAYRALERRLPLELDMAQVQKITSAR